MRKPATASTPAVEALLDHFAEVGFSGAPRSLGRDELGRHVLEYIPGGLAYAEPPLTAGELRRLGALVHELHDAADSFKPPPGPGWNVVIAPDHEDLICHHDLAPWNLVRDGDRWVSSTGTVPVRARGCGTLPTPRRPSSPCALAETQPWTGHGEHWGPAAEYIEAHLERWTVALLD